eukprot:m.16261 g.16261  ORF g.16261 m.16261 type:complete len:292 (-) comp5645_c0_seq1:13-888(-)
MMFFAPTPLQQPFLHSDNYNHNMFGTTFNKYGSGSFNSFNSFYNTNQTQDTQRKSAKRPFQDVTDGYTSFEPQTKRMNLCNLPFEGSEAKVHEVSDETDVMEISHDAYTTSALLPYTRSNLGHVGNGVEIPAMLQSMLSHMRLRWLRNDDDTYTTQTSICIEKELLRTLQRNTSKGPLSTSLGLNGVFTTADGCRIQFSVESDKNMKPQFGPEDNKNVNIKINLHLSHGAPPSRALPPPPPAEPCFETTVVDDAKVLPTRRQKRAYSSLDTDTTSTFDSVYPVPKRERVFA